MLRCPTCGHEVTEIGNFCPHCGASLAKLSGDTTRVIPAVNEDFQFDELSAEDVDAVESLPVGDGMLLVPHGTNAGSRYLLDADVVMAGRHPRCDIFLDDITVSRQHARFTREGGHIWIHDENSLNGTYVNGALIDGPVALRRGDEVQIGKFRMIFFANPAGQG
jgi:pSer/pThr/pTyr-binding forkhead associated (FHA) protein